MELALVSSLGLLALWTASVAWTWHDARARLRRRPLAHAAAAAAGLLPGAGLLLYLALRPAESALDRRERRAVRRLLELELHGAERCLVCRTELRPEYRCCPGCGEELGSVCGGCGTALRPGWQVCPRCETPAVAPPDLHAAA